MSRTPPARPCPRTTSSRDCADPAAYPRTETLPLCDFGGATFVVGQVLAVAVEVLLQPGILERGLGDGDGHADGAPADDHHQAHERNPLYTTAGSTTESNTRSPPAALALQFTAHPAHVGDGLCAHSSGRQQRSQKGAGHGATVAEHCIAAGGEAVLEVLGQRRQEVRVVGVEQVGRPARLRASARRSRACRPQAAQRGEPADRRAAEAGRDGTGRTLRTAWRTTTRIVGPSRPIMPLWASVASSGDRRRTPPSRPRPPPPTSHLRHHVIKPDRSNDAAPMHGLPNQPAGRCHRR